MTGAGTQSCDGPALFAQHDSVFKDTICLQNLVSSWLLFVTVSFLFENKLVLCCNYICFNIFFIVIVNTKAKNYFAEYKTNSSLHMSQESFLAQCSDKIATFFGLVQLGAFLAPPVWCSGCGTGPSCWCGGSAPARIQICGESELWCDRPAPPIQLQQQANNEMKTPHPIVRGLSPNLIQRAQSFSFAMQICPHVILTASVGYFNATLYFLKIDN